MLNRVFFVEQFYRVIILGNVCFTKCCGHVCLESGTGFAVQKKYVCAWLKLKLKEDTILYRL